MTLKQQINSQKQWKMKELILFGFHFYSLFSAQKIVGMTTMCNWCDVMNIMWCNIQVFPVSGNVHVQKCNWLFRDFIHELNCRMEVLHKLTGSSAQIAQIKPYLTVTWLVFILTLCGFNYAVIFKNFYFPFPPTPSDAFTVAYPQYCITIYICMYDCVRVYACMSLSFVVVVLSFDGSETLIKINIGFALHLANVFFPQVLPGMFGIGSFLPFPGLDPKQVFFSRSGYDKIYTAHVSHFMVTHSDPFCKLYIHKGKGQKQ